MKGLILAAGEGRRLRPLTNTGPKHLIPIAGKPMMQYGLEHLINAGVRDIGIVVGYMKEKIMNYFGDGSNFGARFSYIYQDRPLGLAHAVNVAREYIDGEPFAVYLGDNIFGGNLVKYVKEFEQSDYDALITLTKVKDPSRFGVAEFKNGKVVRLVEKPKMPPSEYALVGIYFFRESIFEAIKHLKPSWRGEYEITDAIQWLIDHGYNVHYEIIEGWWKDTGKPEDLLEALYFVLDNLKGDIRGYVAETSKIIGRVFIGEGSKVMDNVTIKGPVYIGKNSVIGPNTYIGSYTSIEDNVKIEGGEISSSIILSNCQISIKGMYRIIDSIIGQNSKLIKKNNDRFGTVLVLGESSQVVF